MFISDAHDGVNRILVYRAAHRVCPDRNNMHSRIKKQDLYRIMLVYAKFLSIVQPTGPAQTGITCKAGWT